MRLTSRSVILTGAGVVILGTSLALSSAGIVSGSPATERQVQHETTCKSSSPCLLESNTGSGAGIRGTAQGRGSAGVSGNASGFNGFGVKGQATGSGGTGVEGISTTVSDGVGVYAVGAGEGVAAYNPICCNRAGYGITSQVDDYSAFPIYTFGAAEGSIPAGSFIVDAAGNGVFDGSVTAFGGFSTSIRKPGGVQVRASVPIAPRATIEDTGTARLSEGVGVVHLEPDFASTLDTSKGYQVFITPDGETRGWLYVATKYQRGFVVREAERGRSSVYFDYRVVAHPAGSSDERFPLYHQRRLHRPHLPTSLQQVHLP